MNRPDRDTTHRSSRRTTLVWMTLLSAIVATLLPSAAHAETLLRVGTLAFRPTAETIARWQPTADHLARALPGLRFEIVPMDYTALERAVEQRHVDLVLTNPSHFIVLRHHFQASPIATLIVREHDQAVEAFGGVIVVRADDEALQHVADLRGLAIASPLESSLGGYQAQAIELVNAGIDPREDVSMRFTEMPHDRALEALLSGEVRAAFVRTGLIEALIAEGRLDSQAIRILNRQNLPNFPFALSTRLYPEWPFAGLPGIGKDLARQLAITLMSITADNEAARKGDYVGWTVPADYEPVRRLLEHLGLPPYSVAAGSPGGRNHPPTSIPLSLLSALALAMLVGWTGLLWTWRGRTRLRQDVRELENDLRHSEHQFSMLAAALNGIPYRCRVDDEWSMIRIGQACEQLTGYPADHFVDGRMVFVDLIHPDDAARVTAAVYSAVARDEDFVLEYRIRHADGGWRRIRDAGQPGGDTRGNRWIDGVLGEIGHATVVN